MTFFAVALSAAPARYLTARFWRDYLVTMRPYLCFVSGFAGLTGLALAPTVPPGPALVLAAAFFLSYGFGQALTDCFQTDTDALSAPYRPLVRGTLRPAEVMVISLMGLAACGVAVTAWQPVNLLLAALCVVGLATYTPFKRRWWAGPFYNAWIVALLSLVAWLAGTGAAGAEPDWPVELAPALAAVFFGYANFVLAGYFKDVEADRATGYRTMPVVFGQTPAAWLSDGFAGLAWLSAAAAVAFQWAGLEVGQRAAVAALLGAAGVVSLRAQLALHGVRQDRQAHRAVVPVVHAELLLLVAVAAACRPAWLLPLIALYGAFAVAVARRPARTQV
jgi:4-hydroxybenzoate polyprenyltransferase